ncbi:MAG: OmpA family protein [Methylobacter sp.]
MQNKRCFLMTLNIVVIASGCSMAQNPSLTEAYSSYHNVRSKPQVAKLAAPELKAAEDSLNKASHALSENDSDDSVDHLSYIASQRVAIAKETARWKAAELAVINAAIKRIVARRLVKTANAGVVGQQTVGYRKSVDRQAADFVVTAANQEHSQAQADQQAMQLNALNAQKTEHGFLVTLDDVVFYADKAQLQPDGMRSVRKLADFLNRYPQYKVLIKGHTENISGSDVNRELSDRRAHVVRTALNEMGVGGDRIRMHYTFSSGGNRSAVNRQLNRRVEIILSEESGSSPR